jgi:hypothetical protein
MRVPLLICLTFILLCFSQTGGAADPTAAGSASLTGKWVLCQDQDNGPKETLQFFPEGYGFTLRREKPKVPFLYKIFNDEVLLAINASGNLLTIYLHLNEDQTKLTLKSERTGHLAFYVHEETANKFRCTAK